MLSAKLNLTQCCPACNQQKLRSFFKLNNIPVNSCLLLADAQAAMEFPCADLELAVCSHCGFISNIHFDSELVTYQPEYEDQQSYSATFNSFAQTLAGRIVDHFGLLNKDIIEVGCGKGDFLILLCELGNNRGVGIDPTIAPQRQVHRTHANINWVVEFIDRRHSRFPADFICCRHTLEHISDVYGFLQILREIIGNRSVPIFIEVPDAMRIFTEGAFEDIYYEHCSYFTPGSLARLFRTCGFNVTQLYREYDNQYLMLEADATTARTRATFDDEEEVSEILAAVDQFRQDIDAKRQFWNNLLEQYQGQRIAIWGSGSKCVAFISNLKVDLNSLCVVDINPHRQGKFIAASGLEIFAPEQLQIFRPQLIIVMNRIYTNEIDTMLKQMAVTAKLMAL